jgi:hypothetical protein
MKYESKSLPRFLFLYLNFYSAFGSINFFVPSLNYDYP